MVRARDTFEERARTIALLVDDAPLPSVLADVPLVDFGPNFHDGIRRLRDVHPLQWNDALVTWVEILLVPEDQILSSSIACPGC